MKNYKKPIIVTDVDDVIVDCQSSIINCMEKAFNLPKPDIWTSYDLTEVYGISNDDIFKAFKSFKMIENTQPHIDAKKTISEFKKMGFDVIALTARGWHPDGKKITETIFKDHNVPIDEVIAVPLHSNKSDIMNSFSQKPFLFIDDHVRHIENAVICNSAQHFFIRNQSWNQSYSHPLVHSVNSLTELLEITRKLI